MVIGKFIANPRKLIMMSPSLIMRMFAMFLTFFFTIHFILTYLYHTLNEHASKIGILKLEIFTLATGMFFYGLLVRRIESEPFSKLFLLTFLLSIYHSLIFAFASLLLPLT